jgi:multisubunit Na+/H+ antiporter MnhG subunit
VSFARDAAVAVILALSVLVTAISAIGVVAMRDPFQRLHFMAPPATVSFLVVAALAIDGAGAAACVKAILVAVLLTAINGILTHATARAAFVTDRGRWPPDPGEAEDAREGGS